MLPEVILKPGREKSVLRHHPWIFSGAIATYPEGLTMGETVLVRDYNRHALGYGAFSPASNIKIRMWTFNTEVQVDDALISSRVQQAVQRRKSIQGTAHTNAFRIIHSESDGLPGVIADQYGDAVVVQILTAGANKWKEHIFKSIQEHTRCTCLVEKSDADVLQLEGLEPTTSVVFGKLDQNGMLIEEYGIKYHVEIQGNQKTGFYLDQRNNRQAVKAFCAEKKVLDCFSFSGGFTLNALAGGADHVTAVDSSEQALDLLKTNIQLNKLDIEKVRLVNENVFEYLRKLRDMNEHFDVIILDPPKFAPTAAQVEKAARAYKDINLLAIKLLKAGGILATFSCSGGLSLVLFQKIVADAAIDAGKEMRILQFLHQSGDHPVLGSFPEGEYLKGMICLID